MTVSVIFKDLDHISFPKEFIEEVRQAMREQYRAIYFKFLLRLKHSLMDGLIEILPFFLAQCVRTALLAKF